MTAKPPSPRALILLGALALIGVLLNGCGSTSSNDAFTWAGPGTISLPDYGIYQNPSMALNPGSNVHNDTYLSDSYITYGPTSASSGTVSMVSRMEMLDPFTGVQKTFFLGECAAQAYDSQGNLLTYSAGLPDPVTKIMNGSIIAINPTTFQVLAHTFMPKPYTTVDPTDFGSGYFFVDSKDRMVASTPEGHVQVLERRPSPVSPVDQYVPAGDYNVTGTGGAVTVYPQVLANTNTTAPSLYALMPDKAGNIWFTVKQGIAGFITPGGQIRTIDLNDPAASGTPTPQADGNYQQIANSEPVDEGENGGPSGVYVMTTYNQYRLQAGTNGTPEITWVTAYDHGTRQKPGQVSFGSGTSPTIFKMGGRRFVTIADNATYMHINVYRAEIQLNPGETRLFAQIAPFGTNPEVSDENSLIVAPAEDGSYCDIFCENNWGYLEPSSVEGTLTTSPGFARVRVTPDGGITVGSVNSTISVPTLVSKMSIPSQTVYTYNKTETGWFLTGLDARDLNNVRFSIPTGPGTTNHNNHYAALSMSPNDPNTFFIGTMTGMTRVILTQ